MACTGQDFRFPLKADIYYATLVQDGIGSIEKTWVLGESGVACELRVDKFNSDSSFAINTKDAFFDVPMIVFGRFKEDIRSLNGAPVSTTNILVTNVRNYCTDEIIFYESFKGNKSLKTATVFEVRTFQPFTNPFGDIEYYKTQIFRMEDQNEVFA